jgi:Flp pilus assembly protein TadB
MSRRERRTLRAIEVALTDDDPDLALLLRGDRGSGHRKRWTRVTRRAAGLAMALFVAGLVLAVPALLVVGALILLVVPPLAWVVAPSEPPPG